MIAREQPLDLRPLDFVGILDRSFELYRRNFWLFVSIAAVIYVPPALATLLASLTGEVAMAFVQIVGALGMLILQVPVTGAITIAISNRYLGQPCTLKEAYRGVLPVLMPLLGTLFIGGLLMLGGTLLCCFPAVIFYFWTVFLAPIVVLERIFYGQAIERNRWLVANGEWARVLLLGIISWMLVQTLQTVPNYLFVFLTLGNPVALQASVSVWNGISQSVLMPFQSIATVVLYYDLRVRKEAFDLRMLAAHVGLELGPELLGMVRPACWSCHRPLYPGDLFCRYCGTLQQQAPTSPATHPCGRCGWAIVPGDAFCRNCGNEIGTPRPESTQTPPGSQGQLWASDIVSTRDVLPPSAPDTASNQGSPSPSIAVPSLDAPSSSPSDVLPTSPPPSDAVPTLDAPSPPPSLAVPTLEVPSSPPTSDVRDLLSQSVVPSVPLGAGLEKCPTCGGKVPATAMFCTTCGQNLVL